MRIRVSFDLDYNAAIESVEHKFKFERGKLDVGVYVGSGELEGRVIGMDILMT